MKTERPKADDAPYVDDPYQLGAAGMPYSTQADYRPIPAGATGTLFDPERLKKGYVRQEIGDGIHYVSSGAMTLCSFRLALELLSWTRRPFSGRTCGGRSQRSPTSQ